ncbi:MAG TPA: hypothetical protein PKD45_03895 [Flavobacteriales bacterium]|nr:hypothetical protein [Flavobacteriales bacterium]
MKKLLAPILALVAWGGTAHAQSATAIRFLFYEGHRVYEKPVLRNYAAGMGVDHAFNDKFTIGVGASFNLPWLTEEGSYVTMGGKSAQVKPHLWTLGYHTEYAVGSNTGTHLYVGSFIGLRRLSQDWTIWTEDEYGVSRSQALQFRKMLIPVGLRMGLRGAVDGSFMDLYGELGYQIGGGKRLQVPGASATTDFANIAALTATLGLSFGIGW